MPVLQSSVRPISTGSGADSGVGAAASAAGRIADFDIAPAQLAGGTAQLSMAMGDNEALRSRLNAKTSELFEVRRQLDRALEYLREQDLAFSKQKDQGQTDTQHIEENSLRLAKALADLEKTTTESNEKSHQILMLERDKDDLCVLLLLMLAAIACCYCYCYCFFGGSFLVGFNPNVSGSVVVACLRQRHACACGYTIAEVRSPTYHLFAMTSTRGAAAYNTGRRRIAQSLPTCSGAKKPSLPQG